LLASIPTVVVSRTADRVGKGIRTAPRDALLGSYSDRNTGAIFGFHRAMDTLGAASGPLIAIFLLYLFPNNFQLIFLMAFVPSAIAVFFTFLVKDKPSKSKNNRSANYSAFWYEVSAEYKYILIMITIFSFVNSSDVFLILKSRYISDSNTIAILGYVFFNIIYAIFSYPLGRLSDKYGKKNIFSLGLMVFSLVYLGFAFSTEMVFIWLLFALYGIYSAATEGVSKAWITDLVSEEWRGTAIGLLTMCSSFAIMLGSFSAGVLWDYFGSMIPFLTSSIISFLIAVILFFRAKA
jgi:MFS family permease